jgi:hypothetical protein
MMIEVFEALVRNGKDAESSPEKISSGSSRGGLLSAGLASILSPEPSELGLVTADDALDEDPAVLEKDVDPHLGHDGSIVVAAVGTGLHIVAP